MCAGETSHGLCRRASSTHDDVPTRERGVTSRPFPSRRRLVTAAVRAGRRIVPMIGLFQVDLTTARAALSESDPPLSLTAYVVACVGRAAARHPQVHAYRDWRGRLVEHRHVDVQVLIEVPTDEGPFGLVHVVRDADVRSVAEISAEIRTVKAHPSSTGNGRLLDTLAPTLGRVPGLYRVMYAVMGRSHRVHDAIGTVQVTALGMFADGGGFAIAPPTLASLTVIVGGVSKRPRAIDDRIEVRDVLDLTVTIDHNVVDGAPATRFAADLRRIVERGVEPSSSPQPAREVRDAASTTPPVMRTSQSVTAR
jgi:pyruvate/2-oxoglutarate dehydrogenase complex dihydrolipoamide acyltransferase (E2) component